MIAVIHNWSFLGSFLLRTFYFAFKHCLYVPAIYILFLVGCYNDVCYNAKLYIVNVLSHDKHFFY